MSELGLSPATARHLHTHSHGPAALGGGHLDCQMGLVVRMSPPWVKLSMDATAQEGPASSLHPCSSCVSFHSLQLSAKDDERIREDGEFSTEGEKKKEGGVFLWIKRNLRANNQMQSQTFSGS